MFVPVVGDADGDGVSDVYGSDWMNEAHGPSTGRIYVYSGRTGETLFTLTGESAGDGFGTSASNAGDVDGDGRADLIVGAWQYGKVAVGAGKGYLYSGRDGRLLATFDCRIPGDAFGFDAGGIGGVDQDGASVCRLEPVLANLRLGHSDANRPPKFFQVASGRVPTGP